MAAGEQGKGSWGRGKGTDDGQGKYIRAVWGGGTGNKVHNTGGGLEGKRSAWGGGDRGGREMYTKRRAGGGEQNAKN